MRRALALAAILLGLLAIGLAAGWWISKRAAPARLEAALEARLAEAIGLPVEIARLEPTLGWGLILHAEQVRAVAPDGHAPLEVDRLWIRLDLSAWLRGDPQLHWIALEDAVVRLERRAEGLALAGTEPSSADGTGDETPLRTAFRGLDALAGYARSEPPFEHVELRGGRVELREPGAAEPELVLDDVRLRLAEGLLGRADRLDLDARLALGSAPAASATLRSRLGADGEARLELRGVPLAELARWLGDAGAGLDGTADARLGWRPAEPRTLELTVEAHQLVCCGSSEPALRLETIGLAATLVGETDLLRASPWSLRLPGIRASGAASLTLPLAARSRLELEAALEPVGLVRLERSLERSVAGWRGALRGPRERLRGGEVRSAALTLAAPLERVPALLRARSLRDGERLVLEAELAETALEIGPGAGIEGLSGRIRWTGPELALQGFEARLDGSPLPRLDARLRGLRALAGAALPCPSIAAVPPLEGRRDLGSFLRGGRPPGAPRTSPPLDWRLALSESELRHPALVCALESARGEIRPAEAGGVRFEVFEGLWAGLSVQAQGRWRSDPRDAVELSVRFAPGDRERAGAPVEAWAHGRFALEIERMGPWRTRSAEGRYALLGARLRLEEARVQLRPAGRVEGDLEVALRTPAPLPWTLRFALPPVAIADLAAAGGRSSELLGGTLIGSGQLTGPLEPGRSPVAAASGLVSLHARDGVVRRGLPPILAITLAGDKLNPFSGRDSIPYAAIDLVGDVEAGRLRTRAMNLDGPALRLLAEGELALAAPHEVEAVVGVFFFPMIDRVIGSVPLLNRMLLGSDENLVSAYFALTGPLADPQARLVPARSLASGPASVVFEGLPAFVRSGISRLQSIFPVGQSSEDS